MQKSVLYRVISVWNIYNAKKFTAEDLDDAYVEDMINKYELRIALYSDKGFYAVVDRNAKYIIDLGGKRPEKTDKLLKAKIYDNETVKNLETELVVYSFRTVEVSDKLYVVQNDEGLYLNTNTYGYSPYEWVFDIKDASVLDLKGGSEYTAKKHNAKVVEISTKDYVS